MGEVHGLVTGVDMQEEKGVRTGRTERSFLEVTRQRSICPPHFSGTLHMGCGTGHRAGTNSAWPGVQPEASRPTESCSGYCRVSGYEEGLAEPESAHPCPLFIQLTSPLRQWLSKDGL